MVASGAEVIPLPVADSVMLTTARQSRGLTQSGLARLCGLSQAFVSKAEAGHGELDGERLLQGSVEHGIAGGVDEVGENHGVFFGEGVGVTGAEEHASGNQDCDQCDGGEGRDFPGFPGGCGDCGCGWNGT